MSAWVQSWSTVAARRGDFRSVSDWLGVDVDRTSRPVLPFPDGDQPLAAHDKLIDARARHALALLGSHHPRRGDSGGGADERKAGSRQYGQQYRASLRSRS